MNDKFKHYEEISEQLLPKGLPIVVRIDGNSFSNLTDEHFEKPFDSEFEEYMNAAARAVMEYCTEARLGYIQSDEASFLIRPSEDPFLGGRVQKLASLFAGHASAEFSRRFGKRVAFDGRAFALPEREVLDYFVWRQEDAFRNCVHSVAFYEIAAKTDRSFATDRLHGADNSDKQEILFHEFGININDVPTRRKRGRCLNREEKEIPIEDWIDDDKRYERLLNKGYISKGQTVERNEIVLDNEIPEFSKDRRYIDYALEDPIPPVA